MWKNIIISSKYNGTEISSLDDIIHKLDRDRGRVEGLYIGTMELILYIEKIKLD